MGRYLSSSLLALVGLLVTACVMAATPPTTPAATSSSGPRLAFDQRSLDFGKVQFGEKVDASFVATNVGDEPLTVRKVDVQTIEGC